MLSRHSLIIVFLLLATSFIPQSKILYQNRDKRTQTRKPTVHILAKIPNVILQATENAAQIFLKFPADSHGLCNEHPSVFLP